MLYSTGPRCRLIEWLTPALWCHTLKLFVGWATTLLDLLALDEHSSLLSYSISDRDKSQLTSATGPKVTSEKIA